MVHPSAEMAGWLQVHGLNLPAAAVHLKAHGDNAAQTAHKAFRQGTESHARDRRSASFPNPQDLGSTRRFLLRCNGETGRRPELRILSSDANGWGPIPAWSAPLR